VQGKIRAGVTDPVVQLFKGCRRATLVVGLCFAEARPVVQGIFLLRLLTGVSFSGLVFSFEFAFSLLCGAISWVCATTAVYLYNGVRDVEEDRANGSSRPIARGALSVTQAMFAVYLLGALSLLGCALTEPSLVWGVVAILVIGWLYSGPPLYLKRWPAGLAITAVILAVPTYYAGYALGAGGVNKGAFIVFVAAMVLWMVIAGQTKDLSDVRGDEKAGRRSLPIVWGEEVARCAISGAALALGGMFLLTGILFIGEVLIPSVALLLGALAVAVVLLGPWGRGDRAKRRRPYRAFMITQYVANVAAILTRLST
jgi:4-hydroxybenzoate polyprenyltransferase